MCPIQQADNPAPHECMIPAEGAELYAREIGEGQPIVILHGGPDFDHSYLLPEMDRLADSFRLIYYDQRGRGRSARNVQPEEVTVRSDIEDIERLRTYFQLETMAVLGHSWGGVLAMEYAIRYPERLSHLILMSSAPASHDDYLLLRQDRRTRAANDIEALKWRATDIKYQQGDPDTDAAYYRIHFRAALRQPEHLDIVIRRLRASLTQEGILKSRAIEDRLMDQTWLSSGYDLLPQLKRLHIPTLVIHGDYDIVPVDCAAHIAQVIAGSQFVLLQDCGHFAYLECMDKVHKAITDFFEGS